MSRSATHFAFGMHEKLSCANSKDPNESAPQLPDEIITSFSVCDQWSSGRILDSLHRACANGEAPDKGWHLCIESWFLLQAFSSLCTNSEDSGTFAHLSLEWACAAGRKYFFHFIFFCFIGELISLFCSGLFYMGECWFFFFILVVYSNYFILA